MKTYWPVCLVINEAGKIWHQIHYWKKASWWRQCDSLDNVLLGNLEEHCPEHKCVYYFYTYLNIAARIAVKYTT